MTRQLDIVLVGHGAIAEYVTGQVSKLAGIQISGVLCRECSCAKAEKFASGRFPVFTSTSCFEKKPDLLVDCAGHSGLVCHAPDALRLGIDVISISTGAVTQDGLLDELEASARAGNSKLKFLSGAIGGIDALTSAASGTFNEVNYTGRKPPKGWRGSPAEDKCDLENLSEPFEHFYGTAREAAQQYPKNANVAATIALATIGLENLQVRLVADPGIQQNHHEVEASGEFGSLSLRLCGNSLPNNPKSSALAAMSIVGELRRRLAFIEI